MRNIPASPLGRIPNVWVLNSNDKPKTWHKYLSECGPSVATACGHVVTHGPKGGGLRQAHDPRGRMCPRCRALP